MQRYTSTIGNNTAILFFVGVILGYYYPGHTRKVFMLNLGVTWVNTRVVYVGNSFDNAFTNVLIGMLGYYIGQQVVR